MTLRSRAILIICGVLAFLILSPIAILFAYGYRYDFDSGEIIRTGVLTVKSDPRGATVSIDESGNDTTPLTKRFLVPKQYQLSLDALGYQTWRKNVLVHAGRVTNVPDTNTDKVYLLLQDPIPTRLATSTQDILYKNEELLALEKHHENYEIKKWDVTAANYQSLAKFAHPGSLALVNYESPNHFLLRDLENGSLWYWNGSEIKNLPDNIREADFSPSSDSIIALTSENKLIRYLPPTLATETLAANIKAFLLSGGSIYLLTADNALTKWDNGTQSEILKPIPEFSRGQLIVSNNRQIFLLLDGRLYQVTDRAEELGEQVKGAFWDNTISGLVYWTGHDIWLFRPFDAKPNTLITRIMDEFGEPAFNAQTNYFFGEINGQIKAIENSANQANIFDLGQRGAKTQKLFATKNGKYLLYLAEDNLYRLTVR